MSGGKISNQASDKSGLLQTAAAVAGILGTVVAIAALFLQPGQAKPESPIRIGNINSKHPDYVDLVTTGDATIGVSGYQVCQQDASGEDRSCCSLEDDLTVSPGTPLRVWFYSAKDPEKRAEAVEARARGEIVCDRFGIKSGETIQLVSPTGTQLDEQTAQ
jgi:hypothetical protein